MRRITIWLTTTLAVVALVFAYELNQSGSRADEQRTGPAPVATCQTATPCPTPTTTSGSAGSTATSQSTTGGNSSAHSPRPGENK